MHTSPSTSACLNAAEAHSHVQGQKIASSDDGSLSCVLHFSIIIPVPVGLSRLREMAGSLFGPGYDSNMRSGAEGDVGAVQCASRDPCAAMGDLCP